VRPDLNPQSNVDAISVRIGEDERTLTIILVFKDLMMRSPLRLADLEKCRYIFDEHVESVRRRRDGIADLAKVNLGGILFQDHEADRAAVLEDLLKAEDFAIKGACGWDGRRRCACLI
jgi:hypothetical protein